MTAVCAVVLVLNSSWLIAKNEPIQDVGFRVDSVSISGDNCYLDV
jgi:hypothetical protein